MTACVSPATTSGPTASAIKLGAGDLWASEVLLGCASAHYTPQQELLGMLAPPPPPPRPSAASGRGSGAASVIDVDAEEKLRDHYCTASPDAAGDEGAYQPYLKATTRSAPSAEMLLLRSALPPALLRKAYRLQAPCMTRHTTKQDRLLNCTASPRCMAGLQLLGGDAATREDCLRVIMGDGPYVVPLPVPPKSGNTTAAAAAARAVAGAQESSPDTDESTVMGDPAFPCLWRGVRNLANTCYFSSVLQLVFSIARVRHAILNDGAAVAEPHGSGQLAESGLKELLSLMAFSREGPGADPRSFASYLSLDATVQQDAQEFFALLLDWLRCHCGPVVKAAVTSTFSGTLLYDRQCGACGRSAKRAEPFLYLSLPVRLTLEDSLSEFSKPEAVDGFMCDKCGQTAVATSRQYMRTLPDVLVIHWNRFEFDLHTLQRHKVTTATTFPLQLDMATYMRQWHEQKRHNAAAAAAAAAASSSSNNDHGALAAAVAAMEEKDAPHHLYELRGVVNHLGDTAVSGHYTYHGKVTSGGGGGGGGSSWLNFNDAEVTKLNRYHGQRGTSPDAYLLVYHRITAPAQSPAAAAASADPAVSAPPTPAEFPVYLRQYVDRVNAGCLAQRQEWLRQRGQAAALFDAWAAAAKAVFEGGATASSAPAWISTAAAATAATPSLYIVPTRWLQHFGRFFLPAYVDATALGGGAETQVKRSKKDTGAGDDAAAAAAAATDPARASGAATTAAGAEEQTSPSVSGDGAAAVDGVVVAPAAAGPLRHGHMQTAEELCRHVRQHSLLQALPSMTCAHGYVSPWASYKLISAAAYSKLLTFLAVCGAPLTAATSNDESASPSTPEPAAASGGAGVAPSVSSSCAFTDANLCPLCVAAMAAGVQRLAVRTAEDDDAELRLTRAWEEAERRKGASAGDGAGDGSGSSSSAAPPPANAAAVAGQLAGQPRGSDAEEEHRVLVSETVVEAWASFYASQLGWVRVRQAEGFTGVLVMREARAPPPPLLPASSAASAATTAAEVVAAGASPPAVPETISTSLATAGEPFTLTALNVDEGDLNLSAQLLCPHGALRPGQHVVAIPASLRLYWIRRFTEVLTLAYRAGVLRTTNPRWCVSEHDVEHFLLPHVPASTTSTTCLECMRSSVQHLTSRHAHRMKRMEERKRFPSLWLAGAMTSPAGVAQLLHATGAENEEQLLAAQHPNRLFFKQHGEREYREHVRSWVEAHQQRVAHQTAEVQRLRTALEKKRKSDAAWNARVSTRRGGGGGRGAGRGGGGAAAAAAVAAVPSSAAPADPQTLEGRLCHAEEALSKLTAQTVPACTVAYGCVPTWWVAQWYAAMQEEDRTGGTKGSGEDADGEPLLSLPRISFAKLRCAHGNSLLEVPWLNPSDAFWQGTRAKRAEALWCGAQATGTSPPAGPTAAEYRSQCWLPPMTILPMDEYVALLTQYGEPEMLERAASPSVAGEAALAWNGEPAHLGVTDVDAEERAEEEAAAALSTAAASGSVTGDAKEHATATPHPAGPTAALHVSRHRLPLVPVAAAVMQVRFHNGVRQLWPPTCTDCCAAMLANFDVNCESFINGSLKLNIHLRKSRKNFYDAMSVLSSSAVQRRGVAEGEDCAAGTAASSKDGHPAGIHYTTTLGQLRLYISAHLSEKHGYLVPPELLQVGRGKNKPLRRRSPMPQAVEEESAAAAAAAAATATAAAAALDEATLQELGIRDGETLSVQSVDAIAQTCAVAVSNDEEWEAIPPELLQAGGHGGGSGGGGGSTASAAAMAVREHTAAFRETRLQGSHGTSMPAAATTAASTGVAAASPAATAGHSGAVGAAEERGAACSVCTFLNAPGMVVCEMCEAPLPSA
ncbi:ubiquitin hydrolase [Novymonas esmeraldas]|uniref:ubiquitinyl hydrolase 1 n=1 Tax=Novymonas esmeraldas TaxID=1808958 RepID=A0AAW0EKF8_9TRYP